MPSAFLCLIVLIALESNNGFPYYLLLQELQDLVVSFSSHLSLSLLALTSHSNKERFQSRLLPTRKLLVLAAKEGDISIFKKIYQDFDAEIYGLTAECFAVRSIFLRPTEAHALVLLSFNSW